MVQLHCPRCEFHVPVRDDGSSPRVCPRCAANAKLQVPLAAIAPITRGVQRPGPAAA